MKKTQVLEILDNFIKRTEAYIAHYETKIADPKTRNIFINDCVVVKKKLEDIKKFIQKVPDERPTDTQSP